MKKLSLSALSLLFAAASLRAAGPQPPEAPLAAEVDLSRYVLEAKRFAQPPLVDGLLDDEAWKEVEPAGNFIQFEPENGKPAVEQTEFRMGYDRDNLYFGVRCYDSQPDKVIASQLRHDSDVSHDDSIKIFLDSFHDRANAYIFMVNALGAQVEGTIRNEGEEESTDWDGYWVAKAHRDAQGWTAEVAIPFKTLRFPKGAAHDWGFNLRRWTGRLSEDSTWTPIRRAYNARSRISRFGVIRGIEGVEPGGKYAAIPYVIGRYDQVDKHGSAAKGDAGGDFKINLSTNLVADLTVNTDFAEVEADQQQVNLNRFRLFYPEKRQFFLESENLFFFGDRIEPYDVPERFRFFFSRQIGLTEDGSQVIPILGGAKLSGKVAGWSLGAMNLTTEATDLVDATGRPFEEPQTNYSVIRVKRDIYPGSTIGVIGINKDPDGSGYNRGGGFDWFLRFGKHFSSTGYLAKTSSPEVSGDDRAASADLLFLSKYIRVHTLYTDIGNNFNPELGFITRVGIKKSQTDVLSIFTPDILGCHKLIALADLNHVAGQDGELQSQIRKAEINCIGRAGEGVAWIYNDNIENLDAPLRIYRNVVIPAGHYRFKNLFTGAGTNYNRKLGATVWWDQGGYYNGKKLRTLFSVVYKPARGLIVVGSWDRSRVELDTGKFTTDIRALNVDWALSTTLTARVVVQHNYNDNLRGNFLLDWTYQPGSHFYLVYNNTEDLFDARRDSAFSSIRPGQQVVLKLTRQFDF